MFIPTKRLECIELQKYPYPLIFTPIQYTVRNNAHMITDLEYPLIMGLCRPNLGTNPTFIGGLTP